MNRDTAYNITIAAVVGIFVIGMVLQGLANYIEATAPVESNRFEVIDTYKGCDVVQYQRNGLAEYKYFLHCEK